MISNMIFQRANKLHVQLCNNNNTRSLFLQNLCRNTRKRRQIENVEVKTKFATSKIRVYDNKDMYQMENKSPQKSCK